MPSWYRNRHHEAGRSFPGRAAAVCRCTASWLVAGQCPPRSRCPRGVRQDRDRSCRLRGQPRRSPRQGWAHHPGRRLQGATPARLSPLDVGRRVLWLRQLPLDGRHGCLAALCPRPYRLYGRAVEATAGLCHPGAGAAVAGLPARGPSLCRSDDRSRQSRVAEGHPRQRRRAARALPRRAAVQRRREAFVSPSRRCRRGPPSRPWRPGWRGRGS